MGRGKKRTRNPNLNVLRAIKKEKYLAKKSENTKLEDLMNRISNRDVIMAEQQQRLPLSMKLEKFYAEHPDKVNPQSKNYTNYVKDREELKQNYLKKYKKVETDKGDSLLPLYGILNNNMNWEYIYPQGEDISIGQAIDRRVLDNAWKRLGPIIGERRWKKYYDRAFEQKMKHIYPNLY